MKINLDKFDLVDTTFGELKDGSLFQDRSGNICEKHGNSHILIEDSISPEIVLSYSASAKVKWLKRKVNADEKVNILFLDFDGPVNNMMLNEADVSKNPTYGTPMQGKLNNTQALLWIRKFCEQFNYKIVVTSSWKRHCNTTEVLRNSGLGDKVEVIGNTPNDTDDMRVVEILMWMSNFGFDRINSFIIVDDDPLRTSDDFILAHFIRCKSNVGYNFDEYLKSVQLHLLQTQNLTEYFQNK